MDILEKIKKKFTPIQFNAELVKNIVKFGDANTTAEKLTERFINEVMYNFQAEVKFDRINHIIKEIPQYVIKDSVIEYFTALGFRAQVMETESGIKILIVEA